MIKWILLSLTLALACVSAIKAQGMPCFTSNLSSQLVYRKDRIVYDLSTISRGNNLKFKIDGPKDAAQLQDSFSALNKGKVLDGVAKGCTESVKVDQQTYAYLCDSNMVIFANLSILNSELVGQKVVQFDAKTTCSYLEKASKRNRVYAICSSTETTNLTLALMSIDTKEYKIDKILLIPQIAKENLSQNLRIKAVTEGDTTAGYSTKIYINEEVPLGKNMRFRAVEHNTTGDLVDLGYFTVANKKLIGVEGVSLYFTARADHHNLLIFVKDEEGSKNYINFCPSSQTTKEAMLCYPKQDTGFSEVSPSVMVYRKEEAELFDVVFIVMANKMTINLLEYIPTAKEINPMIVNNIKLDSSSLEKPVDSFMSNQILYLTGQTADDKTVIIRWDLIGDSWEEQVLEIGTLKTYYVRSGTYDNNIDQFIGLDGGKQFYYMSISQPMLILRPYLMENKTATSMSVNVTCTATGKLSVLQTVALDFQAKLNDNASLVVPTDILSYKGSKKIQIPIAIEDFSGNAPDFKVDVNSTEPVPFTVKYKRVLDKLIFLNKTIEGIQEVIFMGEGLYLIENKDSISSIGCVGTNDTSFECVVEWTKAKGEERVLDAKMIGPTMIIMLSNFESQPLKEKRQVSVLVVQYTGDDKSDNTFPLQGYSAKVGHIKQYGDYVYCMIAGDFTGVSGSVDNHVFTAKYTLSSKTLDPAYSVMKLGSHVCPQEIKFVPKFREKMYLSTNCDTEETARIYEISLSTVLRDGKPVLAGNVDRQFNEIMAKKYEMCPTGGTVNVASFDANVIWGYDEQGSMLCRIDYPVREYGIETIVDFYCDQENKIFQVIGVDKDGKNPVLITYRAETLNEPSRRVHSVVKLAAVPALISSSYNLEFDEINTLLFNTTTSDIQLHQIYTGAPWIELYGEKLDQKLYTVSITATYPDSESQDAEVKTSTRLQIHEQLTKITISPSKTQKEVLPVSGTINLDEHLIYSGPVVRFDMLENDSAMLLDRLSPSEQFRRFTGRYELISVDQDYILAYANGTLSLFQDNKLVSVIGENRSVTVVKSLGKGSGFAALSRQYGASNFELLFILNQQNTWTTLVYQLHSSNIINVVVQKTATGSLFYSCLDSEDQYIKSGLLEVKGEHLQQIGVEEISKNENNVIDFDGVKLNQNDTLDYIVVVSSEDQSKNGKVALFRIEKKSFALVNTYVGRLLRDSSVNDMVDISCNQLNIAKDTFDCFHSRQNLYSANTLYKIDYEKAKTTADFITITFTYDIKNIVNFLPLRAASMDQYIAVVVENKRVDFDRNDTIFAEAYLLLVYQMSIQDDPYKILNYKELGLSKNEDLMYLEPVFFNSGIDNKTKLAVNVASDQVSVKVFNLDDLKLVVSNGNALGSDIVFTGLQIDGQVSKFMLSDLFLLPPPPTPNPPSKGKNLVWLYVILVVIIFLFAIGLCVFFYLKRQETIGDAYVNNEQLRGGFDTENTIKSENSSVIPV